MRRQVLVMESDFLFILIRSRVDFQRVKSGRNRLSSTWVRKIIRNEWWWFVIRVQLLSFMYQKNRLVRRKKDMNVFSSLSVGIDNSVRKKTANERCICFLRFPFCDYQEIYTYSHTRFSFVHFLLCSSDFFLPIITVTITLLQRGDAFFFHLARPLGKASKVMTVRTFFLSTLGLKGEFSQCRRRDSKMLWFEHLWRQHVQVHVYLPLTDDGIAWSRSKHK